MIEDIPGGPCISTDWENEDACVDTPSYEPESMKPPSRMVRVERAGIPTLAGDNPLRLPAMLYERMYLSNDATTHRRVSVAILSSIVVSCCLRTRVGRWPV